MSDQPDRSGGQNKMELIRITYPEPDDSGHYTIDIIAENRDVIILWKDQFGTYVAYASESWQEYIQQVRDILP